MRKAAIFAASAVMLLAFMLPTSAALAQQTGLKDKIVGAWRLISEETLRPNGQALNIAFGPHPTGMLIYLPNGYMAVQIMSDPRTTFADPKTNEPTCDELKNAYWGYYAYWGTYTINAAGDGVVHNVQASEHPPEVGLKYPRSASIEETKLVITTPHFKAGFAFPHKLLADMQIPDDEQLTNRLTFERIP